MSGFRFIPYLRRVRNVWPESRREGGGVELLGEINGGNNLFECDDVPGRRDDEDRR